MGLSSNVLWHQTTRDGLIGILNSKELRYGYSREEVIRVGSESLTIAIPMVSMSDLPISELGYYMDKYGGFILGLRSEWGVRSGFVPVWYTYRTSDGTDFKSSILDHIVSTILRECVNPQSHKFDFNLLENHPYFPVVRYMKIAEGPLKLKDKEYKNYRFADEREVRMCPDINAMKGREMANVLEAMGANSRYEAYKSEHGGPLLPIGIPFEAEDIEYVIVKTRHDIKRITNILNKEYPGHKAKIFLGQEVRDNFIGSNHDIKNEKPVKIKSEELVDALLNPSKLIHLITKQEEQRRQHEQELFNRAILNPSGNLITIAKSALNGKR